MTSISQHIMLLSACVAIIGCNNNSNNLVRQDSQWDNYRYVDNDTFYSLPVGVTSCMDDAPGCN